MAYNSSKLKTITTGYAEYTFNFSETLDVLLAAGYFSGVDIGTRINFVDGTYNVVKLPPSGFNFIVDGAGTAQFSLQQNTVVSRTATADGLTTGIIAPAGLVQTVSVTSASANNIIVLPPPIVGAQVNLFVAANGFELRSNAPATVGINGGTGASAESAIAANSFTTAICTSLTNWQGFTTTGLIEAAA